MANFEWKWSLLSFFFPGWSSDHIDVLAACNTNVKVVETPFCKAKTVSFWENTPTRPRLPSLAPGIVIPDMAHTLMCRWTGYGFCPSVLNRVYNLERESVLIINRVLPPRLISFAWWNLFLLQAHKSNDYNMNLLSCNCQWALKQKTACILSFALNKVIKLSLFSHAGYVFFVLNRVRVSNLQRLNYTQIPVEFPRGYWQILSLVAPWNTT